MKAEKKILSRDLLRSYTSVMYRDLNDENEKRLRTGDVIKLSKNDFQDLLKNYYLFESLIENYYSNSKYSSQFWAVMNKPCDMVHEGTQKFKSSSLFLVPLQSFRGELRKGCIFGDYVLPPTNVIPTKEKIKSITEEYFKQKANIVHPFPQHLEVGANRALIGKDINNKRKEFVRLNSEWVICEVFSKFEDNDPPELIEDSLKKFLNYLEQSPELEHIVQFFNEFSNIESWISYKVNYSRSIKEASEIRIDESKIADLSKVVFTNQMEVRGRFYYEPHVDLYSEEVQDFSFVIELEDLITFKISEEAIESGALVERLKQQRVVGLSRNYSDRLQNIMGYYYSKIGTPDVLSAQVLSLYDKFFDDFFIGSVSR